VGPMKPRSLRELLHRVQHAVLGGRLPSLLSTVKKTYGFGLPEAARGVVVRRVPFTKVVTGLRSAGASCSGRFSAPGKWWPARISVVNSPDSHERQVLLHEMIHCYLSFIGVRAPGHGAHFVAELERLASLGEGWAAREADRYRLDGKRSRRSRRAGM